ncbi:hypothetical protein BaRGS_00030528, partial [Batillaria attramentaria]
GSCDTDTHADNIERGDTFMHQSPPEAVTRLPEVVLRDVLWDMTARANSRTQVACHTKARCEGERRPASSVLRYSSENLLSISD